MNALANVTNDLLYEVLKAMQTRLDRLDDSMGGVKGELQAIRGHLSATSQDISTIYQITTRQDQRLERIETRLGLLEPAH